MDAGTGSACLVVSGPRAAFDRVLPRLGQIARTVTTAGDLLSMYATQARGAGIDLAGS